MAKCLVGTMRCDEDANLSAHVSGLKRRKQRYNGSAPGREWMYVGGALLSGTRCLYAVPTERWLMKSRSLLRLALIVFLCGWAGSYAMADNTIPWLTGDFFFDNQVYLPSGSGGFNTPSVGIGFISFDAVLSDVIFTQHCSDEACTSGDDTWTGRIDSGSIGLHVDSIYGSYDFSGSITPGGQYDAYECFGFDCYDIIETKGTKFFFTGLWNSGWHSTGEVLAGSYNYQTGTGTLTLTTTAVPEPGTLALLTTASVGLCGALRRRLCSDRK